MFKTSLLYAILWICMILPITAQHFVDQSKVSESLFDRLSTSQEDFISVGILLNDRVDVKGLDAIFYAKNYTLKQRTYTLITQLKAKATLTQAPILDLLNQSKSVSEASIQSFWIDNLIFVDAKADLIVQLSQRSDIAWIELNLGGEVASTKMSTKASKKVGGIEPGIAAINAPAMWDLGYTGYGRKAFIIDSGTEPTHPALTDRYWGNYVPESQAWFDFNDQTPSANDCNFLGHGSLVTGIIVGLDPMAQDTIGVAIEGLWMASSAICDTTMADDIASLQFAIDPDDNPNTIDDMPDVVNNSWFNLNITDSCGLNSYTGAMDALEATGIAVVFAAGNSGPSISTIKPPQTYVSDLVNSFTVGALDTSLQVVGFSSRGPSSCGTPGPLSIRPEVSAPGFDIRSSSNNGNYRVLSGTSMAAPHVAGAILLLKQAFPYLTGTEIKLALYFSAIDLGQPGEDNSYGNGIIDVYAAYNYLITAGRTPTSPFSDYDLAIIDIEAGETILCAQEEISPTIEVQNEGIALIDSFEIIYEYAGVLTDTISWLGSLAPDSTIKVSLPSHILPAGSYQLDVQTINPNATEDIRFLNNRISYEFRVVSDTRLTPTSATVCENANAIITAQNIAPWEVIWFNTYTGGSPSFQGNNFLIPPTPHPVTWYAANGRLAKVGLSEKDSINGQFDVLKEGFLVFNAVEDFILASVKVYSKGPDTRIFQLRDSADNILHAKTIFIYAGESTVDLGFNIETGIGLRLYSSGDESLFQQTSGISYPISYPNWIDITGSSSGNNTYNHFYDWQIFKESSCPRSPATITTSPGTMTANFAATPDSVQLPNNSGDIQFQDLSTNATSWKWDFGDSTTSNDQNPIHTYSLIGKYEVILIASGQDGCTDTYVDSVTITGWNTGIEEERLEDAISLFPNPGTGLFYLKLDTQTGNDLKITAFDLAGKNVFSQKYPSSSNQTLSIDLSSFSNGIYYLKIQSGDIIFNKKLIKKTY